jgi:hypothetical protein
MCLDVDDYCPFEGILLSEILVLGDSHAQVFTHKLFGKVFPEYFFNIVKVDGATVSGLDNPNSRSQTLPIFKEAIKHSKASTAIVLLGEVDVGFVIWYKAERDNIGIRETMGHVIQNYMQLLADLSTRFKVICISTPLPTIQDGNDWGGVANLRKVVKASQIQRTQLTLSFNRSIQNYCQQIAVSYIMLDEESLGEDGLVKRDLLNSDTNNHHYNIDKYAALIIKHMEIQEMVEELHKVQEQNET